MRRTWTIIGVGDVPGSFKWYQSLLGLPETAPAHDYFGQILDSDGTVLLCLHEWGAHEHPSLMSPDHAQPGNGLLLFFRVDDFDMALPRARALVARLGSSHCEIRTGITSRSVRCLRPNERRSRQPSCLLCCAPRSAGYMFACSLAEGLDRRTKHVPEPVAISPDERSGIRD
jgi:catechol 2,3-dioxygenase-like lactoylglutathione lyase family enzyme